MNTLQCTTRQKIEIINFLQLKYVNQINPNLQSVVLGEDEEGFHVIVKYQKNKELSYKRYFHPVAGTHNDVFYHLMFSARNDFEYKVDQFLNLDPTLLTIYIADLFKK